MRRYFFIWIGFIFLFSAFTFSTCQSCTGSKKDNSDKSVRCDGNILKKVSSSSSSSTDNNISDLIKNSKNILRPKHVTLATSGHTFKIFQTEVTNEQFASFLKEKGVIAAETQDGKSNDCHLDNTKVALCYEFTGKGTSVKDSDDKEVFGGKARIQDKTYGVSPDTASSHPVTYVSWYAAKEYCRVIGWELPSESQWRQAAGKERKYPWGETEPDCNLANFAQDAGNYCTADTVSVNSGTGVTPVDKIRHLGGNVYEWTSTIIKDNDKEEDKEDRVVKGGAWDSSADKLQNTERKLLLPTNTLANLGFRCVKK